MSEPDIQTFDFGRCLNGNEHDRQVFAEELGAAVQEIGFSILTNNGVDPHLYDDKLTNTNLRVRLNYYPPLGQVEGDSGASHTRSTSKFYGDEYAVEAPSDAD